MSAHTAMITRFIVWLTVLNAALLTVRLRCETRALAVAAPVSEQANTVSE